MKKRIDGAQKDIGSVEVRSRAMPRKLKEIEAFPSTDAGELLQLS